MANVVAMSGADTIILVNRSFTDFGDGDIAFLTFPNDIMNVKTGKNQNSIFGFNATGAQGELKIRLLRGSADDIFMNSLLYTQQNNPAGFSLVFGQFIKKIGDGQGNIMSDTYVVSGGVFQKQVEGKSNVEGDTEQSQAIYMLKFATVVRTLS